MGALKSGLALSILALAAPCAANPAPSELVRSEPTPSDHVSRWRPHIDEAAARFGVPAVWIERVMRAESGGRTTRGGRPIRSRAGAMGLMQLMPRTWADMRARLGLGFDPDEPRDNILAGTFYLRLMHDRFGYPGLFAAYNAGPERYAAVLAGRAHLPRETRAYLAATTREPRLGLGRLGAVPPARAATAEPLPTPPGIFFIRRDAAAGSKAPAVRETYE